MGFHLQRPFRSFPGLRVDFTEAGAGFMGRGAWSTTPSRGTDTTADPPLTELSCVLVEESHKPAKALGLVLLLIVLAALTLVVAAQG
jgi:hypothetical protein